MEQPKEPKETKEKKGPLKSLKAGIDDHSEQLEFLSTFVRLGVVVWSGFILTLNYVDIPGFGKQQRIDPTFIASVFTGALASFGLDTRNKNRPNSGGASGASGGAYQTIRIETPIKILGSDGKEIQVIQPAPKK